MKIKMFGNENYELEVPEAIGKIKDLKVRAWAAFGAMLSELSICGTTKVILPFEIKDGHEGTSWSSWGFIWLSLPEHQGAHEHALVLCGGWMEHQIKEAIDKFNEGGGEDLDSYSAEYHAQQYNAFASVFGLPLCTSKDYAYPGIC